MPKAHCGEWAEREGVSSILLFKRWIASVSRVFFTAPKHFQLKPSVFRFITVKYWKLCDNHSICLVIKFYVLQLPRFYQRIMFGEFHNAELAIAIAVLTAPNVGATKITQEHVSGVMMVFKKVIDIQGRVSINPPPTTNILPKKT